MAGTTYYRVLINAGNSGCDQAISTVATADIIPDLTVTTQPTNITECIGGTNTMTVAVSGGSGTISISGNKVQQEQVTSPMEPEPVLLLQYIPQ